MLVLDLVSLEAQFLAIGDFPCSCKEQISIDEDPIKL